MTLSRILLLTNLLACAAANIAGATPDYAAVQGGVPLRLRIDIKDPELAALRLQPRTYVKAFLSEGQTNYGDLGIHLKGQYGTFKSFESKPSLTLNMDKFQRDQKFHGLDKFHLNNSFSDPAYMTELLCRGLFRHAGLPASRVTHARAELNGRDAGLFVLVEGHDRRFLRRWFKDFRGNLYDSEFMRDISDPIRKSSGDGPDDRSDLAALAAAAEDPDFARRLFRLGKVLDLEHFYSFLALESLTCHFDGYAQSKNNYWIYHDPTSKKFFFIPHGMDQMFSNPRRSIFPELKGMLADAVLKTGEGRKQYRQRCVRFFTNQIVHLPSRVDELHKRLKPLFVEMGTNAARQHDKAVAHLKERIETRIDHLRKILLTPAPIPITLNPAAHLILTNWLPNIQDGKATLEVGRGVPAEPLLSASSLPSFSSVKTPETSGGQLLKMHLAPGSKPSVALWETRAPLQPGTYQLSALVTADYPIFRGPNPPAELKLWGGQELQDETIRKNAQHLQIVRTFTIESPEEIIIQLIARATEDDLQLEFHPPILTRLE